MYGLETIKAMNRKKRAPKKVLARRFTIMRDESGETTLELFDDDGMSDAVALINKSDEKAIDAIIQGMIERKEIA